eukprot:12898512-Prorocentrum_lima.AAC.1
MTGRMQWDVDHLIGFMVKAIIDEHRLIKPGDFLITLYMTEDTPESVKKEARNHFAPALAAKGAIE